MKTVLSLHRKWAHAVKTIRILQGLVSDILPPWLRFDHICGVSTRLSQAAGPDGLCDGQSVLCFIKLSVLEMG